MGQVGCVTSEPRFIIKLPMLLQIPGLAYYSLTIGYQKVQYQYNAAKIKTNLLELQSFAISNKKF